MAESVLIEQLRAKVEALRSPRGGGRGARDAADSSAASTTSKDSGCRLNSARGPAPPWEHGQEVDSAIVVNVGGVNYTTTVATLKAVESSYFSLMLNGLWEPARTRGGDIFVDRNGELFGYVLEHLRAECHREPDTLQLPDDLDTLNALLREAEFYRLPTLVSRLKKRKQEMMVVLDQNGAMAATLGGYGSMDPVPRVELDIAYSTISSAHCQFTEEALHNLSTQVNSQILWKGRNGFNVKDVSSRVHFNPNDPKLPYTMTCTAVLVRERGMLQRTGCAVSAGHCDNCHSSGLVSNPANGSLQQAADSRLRLQLLAAQQASNANQQCPLVSSQCLGRRRSMSLNDMLDQSMNPPVEALGASASQNPAAIGPQERSSFLQGRTQNGCPGGMDWDPYFEGYTGEVRRILGFTQAPGCQATPPRPVDAMEVCSTAEVVHESSKRCQGGGKFGHVLDSPVAQESGVLSSRGRGDVLVAGIPKRQPRLGTHPCCEGVGIAAHGLDSSSDVSMASVKQEGAADTLVTDHPAVAKEETLDGIEICWSESSDSGSLTSEASVCEPPATTLAERPVSDGHDESREADRGLAGGAQHSAACCIDAVHSGGTGDTILGKGVDAGEGNLQSMPESLISGTEGTADVPLKRTLHGRSNVKENRGRGLDDTEVSAPQDMPRSACEPAMYQHPNPDREAQRQRVQQRYMDAYGNVLSPRDSRALSGRDVLSPRGVRVPSDGSSFGPPCSRVPSNRGPLSPREARAPLDDGVLSPRASRISMGRHLVSPRGARAPLQESVLSPRSSRAPSERNCSMVGQLHTLTEEGTVGQEGPSHGTMHRGVGYQSGSSAQGAAVAGCVSNASQAGLAQHRSKVANATSLSKRLLPSSRRKRHDSSKKERKAADQPGAVPKCGPLFVGAHETSTLQPTLQRDKAHSKAKIRSLIPLLNLAPITGATGREGAQLLGRRPDLEGAHAQGGPIGGMPKSVATDAIQSGQVRPGALAPGLPRRASNTAPQPLSGRGRRPSKFGGAG
ncbi:unnamed protein product [Ostreobium quekettii]|uniref:BTB domain-containing protein n=1 Tax=Ostreobium quekettii TaxID=121088 RepID=A0A8S1IPI9_9CHLO|nr:unnamed protein product [Ostreobium quekettii]